MHYLVYRDNDFDFNGPKRVNKQLIVVNPPVLKISFGEE